MHKVSVELVLIYSFSSFFTVLLQYIQDIHAYFSCRCEAYSVLCSIWLVLKLLKMYVSGISFFGIPFAVVFHVMLCDSTPPSLLLSNSAVML